MGKAAAKAVLREGATPWLIGRTQSKLEAAREEVSASDIDSVKISAVNCFVEEEVRQFFDSIPAASFHHLVVTIGESASCSDIRGDAGFAGLKRQFDLKFFAQLLPVSFGVDKIADGGSIVLTSGNFFDYIWIISYKCNAGALSRRPGKGSTALSTTNAALEAICKGLANDFGPRVRVNCVSPGLTNTEMWSRMPEEKRKGMLEGFGNTLPLKRAGESSDVGEAICFLLTADYTTGTTLDVDGGATIR